MRFKWLQLIHVHGSRSSRPSLFLQIAEKCEKNFPDCGKEVELCSTENIKRIFAKTREELEKIWIQRKELEKKATGIDI